MKHFLIALMLLATNASAEELCKTRIMVVSGSNPALTKVKVTIKKGDKVIAERDRHMFVIRLPCRVKYQAVAVANGKTVKRNFYPGTVKLLLD